MIPLIEKRVGMGPLMTNPAASVLLVDDDKSVLRALSRLLNLHGYAVETFATPEQFMNRPPLEGRGCLILDLNLPGMNGLELLDVLRRRSETLPIVFLTGYGTIPDSVKAMKNGADDFLTKPVDPDRLLTAISQALQRYDVMQEKREKMRPLQQKFNALTSREKEVAVLVARGLLNKQIAGDLGIVEKTVKIHRGRVMLKLGVNSVPDLVRLLEAIGVPFPEISVVERDPY